MAAAAKEARASRRKDDRQLKEYVHTLEVHLDQVRVVSGGYARTFCHVTVRCTVAVIKLRRLCGIHITRQGTCFQCLKSC